MRIGVFGGTFDPPHLGHAVAAADAAEQLGLDRVLFIPAAVQPLKADRTTAPVADRIEMTRRLIAADPRFELDTVEADRGGLSFTVDTLLALRRRWPAGTADLVLLLGADAVAQFAQWKDPLRVRSLAEVVVLTRGEALRTVPEGCRVVPTRRVDVSSTEIRERVRTGKSVRWLVPDPVAEYIAQRGLYR
jgi:nicotinate-nucleotide adenylyltransferase